MGATARTDRTVLSLLGLLLTAAGVLGLLTGAGVFGTSLRDRPVLDNAVGSTVGRNGAWLWPVLALVALLLAALALRWLLAQLAPTSAGDLSLERPARQGATELTGGAITSAVTHEVEGYRGVAGARVRLVGDPVDPELHLRVRLDARADVAAVRRRIEGEAVAHVRQALDRPRLPVRLDLAVSTTRAS